MLRFFVRKNFLLENDSAIYSRQSQQLTTRGFEQSNQMICCMKLELYAPV